MIDRSRLSEILRRAREVRVLVAGDLMLDEFVWGNVARNLTAFARSTAVMGVTGQDAAAGRLLRLLEADGIDTAAVHACAGRPTTIKTRVIARHQQVVRVDRERRCEPPDEVRI